jgi:DNA-binding CsgD family transcriptional regulator
MVWRDEAVRLRGEGMAYAEIGRRLGLSRQRVGKVLKGVFKPYKPTRLLVKCNFCGKEFEVPCSQFPRGRGKFCSRSCKAKFYSPITVIARERAFRRQQRLKAIYPLLKSGLTYREIGKKFGISREQVRLDAKELGYGRPRTKPDEAPK